MKAYSGAATGISTNRCLPRPIARPLVATPARCSAPHGDGSSSSQLSAREQQEPGQLKNRVAAGLAGVLMAISSVCSPALGMDLPPPPEFAEEMEEFSNYQLGLGSGMTSMQKTGSLPAWMSDPDLRDPLLSSDLVSRQQLLQLDPEERQNVSIFLSNTPGVVNITNLQQVRGRSISLEPQSIPYGSGSGFIWDAAGHIVTNYHVVQGASEVQVTLIDQSTWKAEVIGGDADKDVAVLRLPDMPKEKVATLMRPVMLGSSDGLLVGQKVFAIGNPFGLDHTLTQGIISGLGRELQTGVLTIKDIIQTDASINPGNSGGILLDSHGRVIGINTAIVDPSGKGSSSGIGFAIPISMVKGLVEQILTFGRVMRPALGVTIAPPQLLGQLGLNGVLVMESPAGSAAAKAGITGTMRDNQGNVVLGDIIVGINDKPVNSYVDLYNILDEFRVGDKIKVKLLRKGGKEMATVQVTLGERGVAAPLPGK